VARDLADLGQGLGQDGPAPCGAGAGGEATLSPGLRTEFVGTRWPLFAMSLKMGALTVLTLGFYRFWMKTRLRRWYWSAIRPGGHPMEYVGLPEEKLLGFLIAVVILAFYIGVVNLILMFLSFSVFQGNGAAYVVSAMGVVPLWFFARYRARRYILARTRWRGIRFGLEPGAWGYVKQALWHWVLTLLTLGLLWPRKTFYLEKYITDRTRFGDASMVQGGNWKMLVGSFWPVVAFVAAGGLMVLMLEGTDRGWISDSTIDALGGLDQLQRVLIWGLVALVGLAGMAALRYRVRALGILASHRRLGGVRLLAQPRVGRVMWIYGLGYFLTGLVMVLFFLLFGFGMVMTGMAEVAISAGQARLGSISPALIVVSVMGYFLMFLLWSSVVSVFVTLPLLRHYAETLSLHDTEALGDIAQRARDEFAEAEGFAEALDVGAAI